MSGSKQAEHHDREAREYRDAAQSLPRDSDAVDRMLEAAEEHETNAAFLRMTNETGHAVARAREAIAELESRREADDEEQRGRWLDHGAEREADIQGEGDTR